MNNFLDTQRAINASREIIDGRDPVADFAEILVTLEHACAAVLLMTMEQNPEKAARMMNEGLTPGVENRLMMYAPKSDKRGQHG